MTGSIVAPDGAVDTHVHFYNSKYPTAATATMTPPDAWIDAYRTLQSHLNLTRVVAIQPTTYGCNNEPTIEAMAAFGENARGVFVVDSSVTDAELMRLTKLGGRGARFHMFPGGAVPWDILEEVAGRVNEFGWHVQLQLNGRELPERLAMLSRLPGTLVIDHIARFSPPVNADDKAFRILVELLARGRCWIKLSAPYESSVSGGPDFADVAVEARMLAREFPERILWASNWPHPGRIDPPDEAALLEMFREWSGDDRAFRRALVDNPVQLYGF